MEKVCTNCEEKTIHSEDWTLTRELARNNKRMFVVLIVVLCMWLATTVGFIWCLSQYDFSSYDVQQDGEWGNTFIEGGNQGDINYGAENIGEEPNIEEQAQSER